MTSYPLVKQATRPQRRDEVEWRNMISPEHTVTSPGYSNHSDTGLDFEDLGARRTRGFLRHRAIQACIVVMGRGRVLFREAENGECAEFFVRV
jgi:hypothetical protein